MHLLGRPDEAAVRAVRLLSLGLGVLLPLRAPAATAAATAGGPWRRAPLPRWWDLWGVGRDAERRAEVRQLWCVDAVKKSNQTRFLFKQGSHIGLTAPTLTWPCCEMSTF